MLLLPSTDRICVLNSLVVILAAIPTSTLINLYLKRHKGSKLVWILADEPGVRNGRLTLILRSIVSPTGFLSLNHLFLLTMLCTSYPMTFLKADISLLIDKVCKPKFFNLPPALICLYPLSFILKYKITLKQVQ